MTRKIKMLTSLVGERFSYRRGEIVPIAAAEAADLIAAGFAEPAPEAELIAAELAELKARLAAGDDPSAAALADDLAAARAELIAALG